MATPTQTKRRGRISLILGTLAAAVAVAAVAYADTLNVQDLVTNGSATATRSGGGSAEVWVQQTGGACDANGDRINITSNQSWLTIAAPGYVNVNGCGTGNAQSIVYSVTNAAPLGGVATIKGTLNAADPQINDAGPLADFTVTVVARPPSDLASPSKTSSSISLSWTLSPDDTDLSNYQLERSTDNGTTWSFLTFKATGSTGHTDSGVSADTPYCYRLAARFQAGGSVGTLLSTFAGPLCVTTDPVDTTPPVITKSITGTLGTDGWYSSNVTVAWSVTDPESAVVIDAGCGTQNFTTETAGTSSSCTAHSAGGSSTDSVTIKIDKTKPVISATAKNADNSIYVADTWTNQSVTVAFTCADDAGTVSSGVDSNTLTGGTVSAETASGSVTNGGACTDKAGNAANSNTFSPIKIDKTKPVISATAKNADNTTYVADTWTNQDVTVSFSCADNAGPANSGLASNTVGGGGTQSAETATGSFTSTGSCTDNAGNSADPNTFSPVKIDKMKPVIGKSATANGVAYTSVTWTKYDVVVSFTCGDTGSVQSGIATDSVAGDTVTTEGENQSVTNTGSCLDNAGNAANSATFSGINIDKTKPMISATAKNADNTTYVADTWTNQDVTVSFSCADDAGPVSSGLASNTVAGVTLSTETATGSVTNSGACTDNAGNSADPNTFSPIKIDKTKPVISATAKNADNTTYVADTWTNQDVTVSFSCADNAGPANSGLASNTVGGGGTQSAETATGSFTSTGSCTDNAGNSADPNTFSPVKIDKTKPVISATAKNADNSTYVADTWTNQSVTVSFTCADDAGTVNSGVATNTLTGGTVSDDTATGSVTNGGACTDNAGNSANSNTFSPIKVDKTPPSLNITGAADGTNYNVCGAAPARPTFDPNDLLSGLDGSEGDTWTVPATPSGVGIYTYTAHAQDNAGNTSSETRTYKVLYGAAIGPFLQPINMDGSSRFKLGSTVPVKFQALCGTTPISTIVARLNVKKADGTPDPGVDEAVSTSAATTGNLFRWTGSPDNQYIFNLSTKGGYTNPGGTSITAFGVGTWTLSALLDDGTYRSVNIQMPR